MANVNYKAENNEKKRKTNGGTVKILCAAAFFLLGADIVCAGDAQQKIFATRAGAEFQQAQKQFQADEANPTNAWQFARACYDLADFATNDTQRAALANEGIGVCQKILASNPKLAAAHYYLGMNLAQLARTKSFGALKLVREMETEFKSALDLDAQIDFGGPARSLGLLYRDAPGWPISIGGKRKAKMYLEQALKIAPDFPENHLVMIESDLKWRDPDDVKKELDALDTLWPQAQKNFTGENRQRDWADWTARREAARKKLAEISGPIKSPRNGQ